MDYKDNRETDKIESLQRRSRSSANYSKSGVLVIDRERFIILLAMIAFALVLVSVVLVTAITGGGNDNKNQGGALNNDAHVHDLKMSMELVEGKFNLLDSCRGCEYSEVVEADVKNVTMTETNPTCVKSGSRVYTMIKDGQELAVTETLPKIGHKINGVSVDELKNSDGYLVYNGESVSAFEGEEIVCGKVIQNGLYVCSECSIKYKATVIVEHNPEEAWKTLPGNEATCAKEGLATRSCKRCNVILEETVVSTLGHSYRESLKWDETLSDFLVATSCLNGCGYSQSARATDVVETKRVPGNCNESGKIYYSCVRNGVMLECFKEDGVFGDHVFNEKEGVEVYDYEPGYTIPFKNAISSIICGITSNQFNLKCQYCKEIKTIKVKVPNHQYVVEKVITLPTLSTKGTVKLACTHTIWCSHKLNDVTIDKVVIGENGNAVKIPEKGDELYEVFAYKTTVQGAEVELEIKILKADLVEK